LTPHVVKDLPRAANSATVKKYFDKSGVVQKWAESSWAKKRQAAKLRSEMNDCEFYLPEGKERSALTVHLSSRPIQCYNAQEATQTHHQLARQEGISVEGCILASFVVFLPITITFILDIRLTGVSFVR
jgi:hypothetical protein